METAFIGLHKLLDEFGERILEHVDLAAERATALGGVVEGTLREAVETLTPEEKRRAVLH
ncbi:MAG: ferritin-like domain-containing protein [Limisphaerales bacterium]